MAQSAEQIVVTGGWPLNGTVRVPAAKNSVLPLLAAALLCQRPVRLRGVPRLSDVECSLALLRGAGCTAQWQGSDVALSGSPAQSTLPGQTAAQMRASILFCAPLLARLGRAETVLPGGCRIGSRPIDLHLTGLARMGVQELDAGPGRLVLLAPSGLHGAEITLRFPSVGATETLLLAAACARGRTVLRGAAREPEVADLADFLNRCGGSVEGGAGRVRVFAPAGPYFCLHAGLCGGRRRRPGGTDRMQPGALCPGAGNSGTNGLPGGARRGERAGGPVWAAVRCGRGVHRSIPGIGHRCRPAAGGRHALCGGRKQY